MTMMSVSCSSLPQDDSSLSLLEGGDRGISSDLFNVPTKFATFLGKVLILTSTGSISPSSNKSAGALLMLTASVDLLIISEEVLVTLSEVLTQDSLLKLLDLDSRPNIFCECDLGRGGKVVTILNGLGKDFVLSNVDDEEEEKDEENVSSVFAKVFSNVCLLEVVFDEVIVWNDSFSTRFSTVVGTWTVR